MTIFNLKNLETSLQHNMIKYPDRLHLEEINLEKMPFN